MRTTWAILFLFLIPLACAADEPKPDKGKTDPPGVPLQATLTSNQASYELNLGGKTADDVRKMIDAGAYPDAPAVDLSLELKNISNSPLQIRMGGTTNVIDLDLQGPDALSVELKGRITNKLIIAPKTITLEPGKSQTVPITSLAFGFKGSHRAYWLAPGKYTLTASYKTTVSPAPAGAESADEGYGAVTIISAPLTVAVK
ncbi:MAG TPA: hypothetical protein VMS17_20350 [Gemmataceae bacterium]|nr:hypothetical protein [Gemmataceae bacterium]